MKITLEFPYTDDWKYGYLQVNGEGRKTVILFNTVSDRSSTSYARYIMAVKLKRYLTDDEEVDHIDGNKFDDSLKNLQVLSVEEHRVKSIREIEGPIYKFVCKQCGETFARKKHNINKNTKYCSANCRITASKIINNGGILSESDIPIIQNLIDAGRGDLFISFVLKVSKGTVYNFRKLHNILGVRELNDKLLMENIDVILEYRNSGMSYKKIADKINTTRKVVTRFLNNIDTRE